MSGFVMKAELERDLKSVDNKFDQHKLIVTQRKWSAWRNGDQLNITTATWVPLQLNALTFDCDGVGFSSYGYPVQENGIYLVNVGVAWVNLVADKTWRCTVRVNAVQQATNLVHSSHTAYPSIISNFVARKVEAYKNDVIYAYAAHYSGVNTPDIQGGLDYSFMDVHLVSRLCK